MNYYGLDFEKMELKRMIEMYPLPRTSYSQLSSFVNCPHTFYLTYMTKGFERTGNKYTELGSLLHEVFERQGKQLKAKKPFLKSEAFKMYNRLYFRIDKKHFDDKEDWTKMYNKGILAIDNFYTVYEAKAPLFIEKEFCEKIGEGIPPVKAFIDRIDGDPEDPSTWIITDYKSGSGTKTKDYLRHDMQMGLYVAQIYTRYGVYPQAVQFFHPVPNKFQTAIHIGDGVYEFTGQRAPVVQISMSETLLDARAVVAEIIKCVESGNWVKKIDKWSCKMCFHFQSERCKPFETQEGGWGAI